MKWVALLLIVTSAPLVAVWLRSNPKSASVASVLLTFLPFVIGPWHLGVSPFETPLWSGYVKGWQVTLLDAIAFGVIFGTRGRWPHMALVLPFLAYLAFVTLAVFQAKFPNLALSYPIQLARVGLVFLAVARVAQLERGERDLLIGLFLGLFVQACYAVWARANGALQTGGSLGHQNLLGFVSHMALMPAFALLLSGKMPRWAFLGVISGLAVVVLTASRATIAFSAAGLVLTLFLSISLRFTGRKAAVALVGVLLISASFPLANAALERRFQAQQTTFLAEDEEREAFERAALSIISSHPMGVGPNHYVFIANTEGYSERAGVSWNYGSRATQVHNSYLLIAAETGVLGLLGIVSLLASAVFYAFGGALRFRRQEGSEMLIGLGAGLLAMIAHGFVEWMFVVYPTQYVFAGSLGLIVGLRSRFREREKAERAAAARNVRGPSPFFGSRGAVTN